MCGVISLAAGRARGGRSIVTHVVEIRGRGADGRLAHLVGFVVRVGIILSVVRDIDGFLIDIVAGEPASLAVEFSVPPSRGVAVVDLDDLTGMKGETGGVIGVEVVECHNMLFGLALEVVVIVGIGGHEASVSVRGRGGGERRHD